MIAQLTVKPYKQVHVRLFSLNAYEFSSVQEFLISIMTATEPLQYSLST